MLCAPRQGVLCCALAPYIQRCFDVRICSPKQKSSVLHTSFVSQWPSEPKRVMCFAPVIRGNRALRCVSPQRRAQARSGPTRRRKRMYAISRTKAQHAQRKFCSFSGPFPQNRGISQTKNCVLRIVSPKGGAPFGVEISDTKELCDAHWALRPKKAHEYPKDGGSNVASLSMTAGTSLR